MESSIKVDFRDNGNGKGLEPVIAIKLIDSEDPRDGLLKTLFQSLGGESSWLSVSFDHHIINGAEDKVTYVSLYAVKPDELKETAKIIEGRIDKNTTSPHPKNLNPLKNSKRMRK